MGFVEQLRQFLGEAVDEAELAAIALSVLSETIRRLRLAIAGHVCEARGLSEAGDPAAADELAKARALKRKYDATVLEYERVRVRAVGPGVDG